MNNPITGKKKTIWQVVSLKSSPNLRHDRRIVKEFDNFGEASAFAKQDATKDLKIRTKPERRARKDEDPYAT